MFVISFLSSSRCTPLISTFLKEVVLEEGVSSLSLQIVPFHAGSYSSSTLLQKEKTVSYYGGWRRLHFDFIPLPYIFTLPPFFFLALYTLKGREPTNLPPSGGLPPREICFSFFCYLDCFPFIRSLIFSYNLLPSTEFRRTQDPVCLMKRIDFGVGGA